MTLRSGKAIEKSIFEPCEKNDESTSKSKTEVEPEHCKEKTNSPSILMSHTGKRHQDQGVATQLFGSGSLGYPGVLVLSEIQR